RLSCLSSNWAPERPNWNISEEGTCLISITSVFSLPLRFLNAMPGPGVLYIVTRTIDQGRRAGLLSVLRCHGSPHSFQRGRSRPFVAAVFLFHRVRDCEISRRRVSDFPCRAEVR